MSDSEKKTGIGFLDLKAKENDGELLTIPADQVFIHVDETRLMFGGIANNEWGAQIYIIGKIEPGTFYFTPEGGASGEYHSKTEGHPPWIGGNDGGEVTLLEVDMEKRSARGHFIFTARSFINPENHAEVSGSFSLSE